ncbi:hypothetical protein HNR44_001543 [Geomicrobium halophilum]|uniref:Uncharacterized protein n=1 Tax=Geomicrobium halophilum TaxID=549000 RepID=A0A841PP68_9BACL|nr:hypothetical protein [Geomicrobium halophilum]MBB6449594.1 hypothetical protein [Geomicrobium halophilum]
MMEVGVVAGGYAVVVGCGAMLIGAAVAEGASVKREKKRLALAIANGVEIALPWVIIGGLLLFVYLNPLF